jgi:hypothetical protein
VTVQRDGEPFLSTAAGARIGRLAAGTSLTAGGVRSGYTEVTLAGWIFRSSVEAASREGYDLAVSASPEENLRAGPNGRVLARLLRGALLSEMERRGQWVRVQRTGWVATAAVQPPAAPAPGRRDTARAVARADTAARRSAPPPRRDTVGPVVPADPGRAVVRRRIQLFRAPDSGAVGTLEAGSPVRITARAGDWVRVETQAWVRERDVRVSDAAILTGITAAELRGAPDEFRGRLLRWTIQFLALQQADELRSDFFPGQRYILARGPAPEYAFVYVIVPPEKLAVVAQLAPLASVAIVARVVAGRSSYLANPILELVELQP